MHSFGWNQPFSVYIHVGRHWCHSNCKIDRPCHPPPFLHTVSDQELLKFDGGKFGSEATSHRGHGVPTFFVPWSSIVVLFAISEDDQQGVAAYPKPLGHVNLIGDLHLSKQDGGVVGAQSAGSSYKVWFQSLAVNTPEGAICIAQLSTVLLCNNYGWLTKHTI